MSLPDTCPFCGAGVRLLEYGKEDRDGNYVKFECHTYIHLHVKDPCNRSPTCKNSTRVVELEAETLRLEDLAKHRGRLMTQAVDKSRELEARVAELEARCERLEEAGDNLETSIACGCGVDGPCQICRRASEFWQQAKEAKP